MNIEKLTDLFSEDYQSALDCVNEGVIIFDTSGIIHFVNDAVLKTFGFATKQDFLGKNLDVLFGNQNLYNEYIATYLEKIQKITGQQVQVIDQQGKLLELKINIQRIPTKDLLVVVIYGKSRITDVKKLPIIQMKQIQDILETSADGVLVIDQKQIIHSFNPAAQYIFGYDVSEVIGKHLDIIIPRDFAGEHRNLVQKYIMNGSSKIMGPGREILGLHKDGSHKYLEVGISKVDSHKQNFIIAIIRDITERKNIEKKLLHLANYDALTNFCNHRFFHENLENIIEQAYQEKTPIGLFFIDLDRFKMVNDLFGHKTGNVLLQKVAERLQNSVRKGDIIGRLGGDEFGIILRSTVDKQHCEQIAKRIIHDLNQKFIIDDKEIEIGVSIGIAIFPEDSDGVNLLMKKADQAMYCVKKRGKNSYCFINDVNEVKDCNNE